MSAPKKRSEKRQRTAMLATRCTPEQATQIRTAAEAANLSVSAYLLAGAGLLTNLTVTHWGAANPVRSEHDAAVQIAKRVLREGGDPEVAYGVLRRSLDRAA